MSRFTPTDPRQSSDSQEDSDFAPPDESFDWFDPDPDGFEADAAADRYYS